jgi:hypothetical protein
MQLAVSVMRLVGAGLLRREIATIDPAILVSSLNALDAIVSDEVAQPRFRSALLHVH